MPPYLDQETAAKNGAGAVATRNPKLPERAAAGNAAAMREKSAAARAERAEGTAAAVPAKRAARAAVPRRRGSAPRIETLDFRGRRRFEFSCGEYPESLPLLSADRPRVGGGHTLRRAYLPRGGKIFFHRAQDNEFAFVSLAMAGAFALQVAGFFGFEHGEGHGHGSYIFVAAEIAFLMSLGRVA